MIAKTGYCRGFLLLPVLFVAVLVGFYAISAFAAGINAVNLLSPASNSWTSGTNGTIVFLFNFTGDNQTASCQLFINGTGFGVNSTARNTTNTMIMANSTISEGTNVWYVNCTNTTTIQSSTWALNVDRTLPSVSWVSPSTNGTEGVNVTYIIFNISVSENIGACKIEVNGTNQTCTAWVNATTSSYGYYNKTGLTGNQTTCAWGYATDAAGNWNRTPQYICRDTNEQQPDFAPPTISWIAPTASNGTEAANKTYVSWNISVSENIGGCLFQINGTNYTETLQKDAGTSSYCYYNQTGLTGNQTRCAVVYANDTFGNLNMNSSMICRNTNEQQPDLVPPDITINKPLNDTTKSDLFNFTFSDVRCSSYSINGTANVTNCSISNNMWTGQLSLSSNGVHNITVYANDTSGNLNVTIRYWVRDTIAPAITNVTNGSTQAIYAYVTWNTTGESSNSTVWLGADENSLLENASNSSLVTEHNLTVQYLTRNTTYYYNVTSCDYAGNCNTTATRNFTTPVCDSDYSCGSWSSCSGSHKTRTCTDANYCEYPWSYTETASCSSGGGGSSGTSNPPRNVSSRPELVPGLGLRNNTKLQEAIEKVLAKGKMSDTAKENLLRLSSSITSDVSAERTMTFSGGRTRLTTKMIYNGNKKVKNLMIFEKVPKGFATSANSVTVVAPGATVEVAEEDPSWVILYPEVAPGTELSVTYEAAGAKSSTVPDNVQTEVYAESLEVVPVQPTTPQAICTPSARRCEGSLLQQCSADGSAWAEYQTCPYGCDAANAACSQQPAGQPSRGTGISASTMAILGGLAIGIVLVVLGVFVLRKKKAPKAVAKETREKEGKEEAPTHHKKTAKKAR